MDSVPWYQRRFEYCPIASIFIDTAEDAASYYAHKFIGDRTIYVRGVSIKLRFNVEEHHLYTQLHDPPMPECSGHVQVGRRGGRGDVRCFDLRRARAMDGIVPTITNPAVALRAKGTRDGVQIFGPTDTAGFRMCVVVAPDRDVWFVRTAWRTTSSELVRVRANSRATPWPPKSLEPRNQ